MKHLSIFEEFKIRKTKKIYKHLDKERGGVKAVLSEMPHDNVDILEDIMKSLVKRFGLKSNVKYMNAGSFGMAFIVGDKVIKLTSSLSEASLVNKLIGRKIPHCINYYDIVLLKKYEIYAILMDRAEKLTTKEHFAVGVITDDVRYMHDFDKLVKKVKKDGVDISKSKLRKIFDDYRDMYKSLKDNKVSVLDLHEGNIGYLNNQMVHFDVMSDSVKKDVNKISRLKVKAKS